MRGFTSQGSLQWSISCLVCVCVFVCIFIYIYTYISIFRIASYRKCSVKIFPEILKNKYLYIIYIHTWTCHFSLSYGRMFIGHVFKFCGPKKWSLDSGVDDGPKICDMKNPSLPAHCILEPGNTWNTSSEIKRFSEKNASNYHCCNNNIFIYFFKNTVYTNICV